MRVRIIFSAILIFVVLSSGIYGQNKTKSKDVQKKTNTRVDINKQPVNKAPFEVTGKVPENENVPDYKIIASTSSYIEIEFYPYFYEKQKIDYNGNSYSV